jgi:coproporphyrinogen III oxidase-like Fe-S oxidoreductase
VISDVAVLDPTFNAGPDYLMVLEELATHGFCGKISLQCRAEMVCDEFLDAVHRLNQGGAHVVLEFGLQTIHKAEQRIIQRPNNLTKVDKVLEACQSMGIYFEISLIYGLPGQTFASFEESLTWCLKRSPRPDAVSAFPLMLLRGTPIHDRKEELELVESDSEIVNADSSSLKHRILEGIPHVVSSPSFSKSDWFAMAELSKESTKPL